MHELVLHATDDQVESLSEALMELDAVSVSVEDADADTPAEQALFGEPGLPAPREGWQHSVLQALFSTETAATQAATLLLAQPWACSVTVDAIREVPDQDWVRLTQSQFEPVPITDQFWVVPSWHEAPTQAEKVIRLDPGLAFGTGTHPTTRMCLRWIAQHPPSGTRVLDYGCGSGILAIGAARHGATVIDAVDIDPSAVRSAANNALANGVALNSGLPEMAHGTYDLVLANILATPLKVLAPLLCAHLAPGGTLVLAGILERQAQELQNAYAPSIALAVADSLDGWILMVGRHPE